jgi:hypothetical protein
MIYNWERATHWSLLPYKCTFLFQRFYFVPSLFGQQRMLVVWESAISRSCLPYINVPTYLPGLEPEAVPSRLDNNLWEN